MTETKDQTNIPTPIEWVEQNWQQQSPETQQAVDSRALIERFSKKFEMIDNLLKEKWWIQYFVNEMNKYLMQQNAWIQIRLDDTWKLQIDNIDQEKLRLLDEIVNSLIIKETTQWQEKSWNVHYDKDKDWEVDWWELVVDSKNWAKVEWWSQWVENPELVGKNSSELLQMAKWDKEFFLKNFCKQLSDGSYEVDFKWNDDADNKIWLSDFLPETAKKVKTTNVAWATEEWSRHWLKWWFYDDTTKSYMEIHSWYKFQIVESYTQEEIDAKLKEKDERIVALMQDEEMKKLYIVDWKEDEEKKAKLEEILWKAIEYWHELTPENIKSILSWFDKDLKNVSSAQIVMNFREIQSSKVNPERYAYWWWALAWFVDIESISDPALKEKLRLIQNKKLDELTFDEWKALFLWVFWEWPWTDLAVQLAWWNSALLVRTIATAKHEWWLKFWRINRDPNYAAQQRNIWSFQISEKFTPNNNVIDKYYWNMLEWLRMAWKEDWNITQIINKYKSQSRSSTAESYWSIVQNLQSELEWAGISKAQQDVLCWYWYINKERWWAGTFSQLADPNLSADSLTILISTRIQWWIQAIWRSVVAQMDSSVSNYARW